MFKEMRARLRARKARAEMDRHTKERDRALAARDLDWCVQMMAAAKGVPAAQISRRMAEISMHKATVMTESLPENIRRESHDWLISRGYFPGIGTMNVKGMQDD